MENEELLEPSVREREMHFLAYAIREATEQRLDFDSLIRVGRYLVNIGKQEQMDHRRKAAKDNYRMHKEMLETVVKSNREHPIDPETFRRIVHTECFLAEQAATLFNQTIPPALGAGRF